jgi:hypothetical protein
LKLQYKIEKVGKLLHKNSLVVPKKMNLTHLFLSDRSYLSTVLSSGGDKARDIAETTMIDVRTSMGLA